MMSRRIGYLIGAVALASLVSGMGQAAPQDDADRMRAETLRVFETRIGEYAALHRRLEGPLPPLNPSGSPRAFLLNRKYLAAAIKTARPDARQGDIFTPPVAVLFREMVAKALEGRNPEAVLRDLFEEHPTLQPFHPRVYEPYPEWATHQMPPILLLRLPPLPEDVEYRLVDRDLVLWDIHADLIVDVLPNAIGRPTT